MAFGAQRETNRTGLPRRFFAATVLAFLPVLLSVPADAEDLNAAVSARLETLTGKTILFRNDTDRIPQVEVLRADGAGMVWSAYFNDKVVPVRWTAGNGQDGKGVLCLSFKREDVGLPRDLHLCDSLDVIAQNIRDVRDGDDYDLMGSERMKAPLPNDVSSLDDVDRILGR
ncbi:hypothetical protein ACO34A_10820 [Rhizobium sp. ACO-34A]|nr:hypothetical protein [Rhizobium sp. ACO-34A]ATN34294.1 hypothetical protein ACO34A_10820 [Rhizobium sp. ACO-34A]